MVVGGCCFLFFSFSLFLTFPFSFFQKKKSRYSTPNRANGPITLRPQNLTFVRKKIVSINRRCNGIGGGGGGGESGNWQLDVACSAREISLSSSFREALFQRLAGTTCNVFTQLLCR